MGCQVTRLVHSGEEALRACEEQTPDLFLVDLGMPGPVDGLEAARAVAERFSIPVVFATSHGNEDRLRLSAECDPSGYIALPLQQDIACATIRLALEKRGRSRDVARSERQFRNLLDHTFDWEFWLLPEGSFSYVSPSCERISGYSPQEFLNDPDLFAGIVHPEDRSRLDETWRFGNETDTVTHLDFRIVTKNGAIRWLSLYCRPLYDRTGRLLGRRGSARDVTERRRLEDEVRQHRDQLEEMVRERSQWLAEANRDLELQLDEMKRVEARLRQREQELLESENRLRSMYDAAPNVAFILLDTGGAGARVTEFSPGAENLSGYRREKIVGQPFHQLFEEGDRESVKNLLDRLCSDGSGFSGEMALSRKSGKRFHAFLSLTPIRDARNNLSAFLAVAIDITIRKNYERALGESEENVRAILDASAMVAMLATTEGRVLAINRQGAELFGVDHHQVLGQSVYDFFPSSIAEHYRSGTEEVLAGGQACRFQSEHEGRLLSIQVAPVKDREGGVVRLAVLAQDISREIDLERRLQHAQRMEALGTLAGGIAHDFNNILSPILGYTEIAMEVIPSDSRAQRMLRHVLTAAGRARELVQHILSFSRRAETEKRPLQVQVVAKEALKLLRASIPSTISIRTEYNADSTAIMADAAEIHQIVMNLCTNAYYAMRDDGGTLFVGIDEVDLEDPFSVCGAKIPPGRHLRLRISDTGKGIEPDIANKVFEPYFTTKEKGEGTGMGLAMVHGIVTDHEGCIALNSEVGVGTTFDVYFPVLAEPGQVQTEVPEVVTPRGTERIMFVDDERDIVNMAGTMLANLGYEVETFTDSASAWEAYERDPEAWDLVLTDHTMPHMTGAELARKILRLTPDEPVILCTGFSEMIGEEQALSMGIRAFLLKPLRMADLAGTIRAVLEE